MSKEQKAFANRMKLESELEFLEEVTDENRRQTANLLMLAITRLLNKVGGKARINLLFHYIDEKEHSIVRVKEAWLDHWGGLWYKTGEYKGDPNASDIDPENDALFQYEREVCALDEIRDKRQPMLSEVNELYEKIYYELRNFIIPEIMMETQKEEDITDKLVKIRKEALQTIKNILEKYSLSSIESFDIDEDSSPVIQEDCCDEENTFTLDRVELRKGRLSFDASSSCASITLDETTISTDALIAVAEHLEENEDTIAEFKKD